MRNESSADATPAQRCGTLTYQRSQADPGRDRFLVGIAVYGITKIQINDNPIKWFCQAHPIRVADIELNKHFGGTYMAYLVFKDTTPPWWTPITWDRCATGSWHGRTEMSLPQPWSRKPETMLLDAAHTDSTQVA